MIRILAFLLATTAVVAQVSTTSIDGLRDKRMPYVAYVNCTAIPYPGARIDSAVIIVRDERIVRVGKNLAVPQGADVRDLRGAYVRLTLRPPTTGDRLDPSLALTLDTPSSSGLEQLGSFEASDALTAVTPGTVQSRARATSLAIGTVNQGFNALQWDGGVRSSAHPPARAAKPPRRRRRQHLLSLGSLRI